MKLIKVLLPIIGLLMAVTSSGLVSASVQKTELDIAKKLDEYLTRITPFGYSGAFLLAKNGEILLNKGYGMAVREKRAPNSEQTIFCTGSVTKQFTSAGIMKLEMMGKLNTSDAIMKYLPDVPADKQGVSLHNLLTHTSGIGGDLGGDYEVAQRDETVKKILAQPLRSQPGKEFFYSNAGFSLLAAIIEGVSGQSYEEFLRSQLFLPAGMVNTGYRLPDWRNKVIAHWYVGDEDNGTPLEKPFPYWNLLGNGGIMSTTDDMFRWNRALKGDTILSAEVKKKLWTPFLNEYAYGWDVMKTEHGTLIQHDGGSTLGSSFDFRWFVEPDVVIILFCNESPDGSATIFKLRNKIERLVFGGSVEVPPLLSAEGPGGLAGFAGTYLLASGATFRVASSESGLTVEARGQDAIDLLMGTEGLGDRYRGMNNRTASLVAEIQRENYEELGKALGGRVPLDRIKERQTKMRLENQARFGEFEGIEVIGSVAFEGDIATFVEFKYKKGSQIVQYVWGEKNLLGMRIPASAVRGRFLPRSGKEFTGYDLDSAKVLSVKFGLDKKGAVKNLVFIGKSGPQTAQRTSSVIPTTREVFWP